MIGSALVYTMNLMCQYDNISNHGDITCYTPFAKRICVYFFHCRDVWNNQLEDLDNFFIHCDNLQVA